MESNKKKKVLLLITNFGYGGAENTFARLANIFAKRYEVLAVVFTRDEQTKMYPLDVPVEDLGVKPVGFFSKLFAFFTRIKRLKALKKRFQPDCSISFLEGANHINVLAKYKDKTVGNLLGSQQHDIHIRGFKGWIRNRILAPWLYNKSDEFVSITKHLLTAELKGFFKLKHPKLTYIPNFYDIENMVQAAQQPIDPQYATLFDQRKVFVCVGRLSDEKGFVHLIDLWKLLKEVLPQMPVLFFVGQGDQKTLMLKKSQGLTVFDADAPQCAPLAADVVFAGYQSNPLRFFVRAYFSICSSYAEGFPNTILESMICRTPVISADCMYGPGEILDDVEGIFDRPQLNMAKFGILLPPFNTKKIPYTEVLSVWVSLVKQVVADENLRKKYSEKAWERAQDFQTAQIVRQWYEVIER